MLFSLCEIVLHEVVFENLSCYINTTEALLNLSDHLHGDAGPHVLVDGFVYACGSEARFAKP